MNPKRERELLIHDYTQCRRERDRLVDALQEIADDDCGYALSACSADPKIARPDWCFPCVARNALSSLEEQSSKPVRLELRGGCK